MTRPPKTSFEAHITTLTNEDAHLAITVNFLTSPRKGNPHNEFI